MPTATLGREAQKKQLEKQIEWDLQEIAINRRAILASQKEVARLAQETKEILRRVDELLLSPLESPTRA